jgi:hypothetical protein
MSNSRNLASLLRADGSVEPTKYVDEKGGVADFVASGTLPDGQAVILKDDGTVQAVGVQSANVQDIPAGSAVTFSTSTPNDMSVFFDPSNSNVFVLVYGDSGNSGYLTALVGTVSGTSISFGSKYVIGSSAVYQITVAFDPHNVGKFAVSYRNSSNSSAGQVTLGQISGTSITSGSFQQYAAQISGQHDFCFDIHTANKIVVAFGYQNGHIVVGTISGTSISYGTAVTVCTGSTYDFNVRSDPNTANKFIVAYRNPHPTYDGNAVVATTSGTSISLGTPVVWNAGSSESISLAFDYNTANQILIIFKDFTNSAYISGIVGTISGTTLTFGTKVSSDTTGLFFNRTVGFSPDISGKFVTPYRSTVDPYPLRMMIGRVTGSTLSFDSDVLFNNVNSAAYSLAFDPANPSKFVVAVRDFVSTTDRGFARLGQLGDDPVTNLTTDNFIGISSASYADGATATVTLAGSVSDNQTGLTINSTYYVQTDGTIATTADTPSVELGRAISSTSLLLTSEAGAAPAVVADTALSAYGGTTSEYGIYKVHTFTTSGNFSVTANGGDVDVFIVGAGAAGGGDFGGGGGAGNAYSTSGRTVSPNTNYPITIGGGGVGGTSIGGNGSNTNAFGVVASGGGGGGRHNLATPVGGANGGGGGGDSSRSGAVGSIASYADWTNHGGFSGGNGTQHAGGGGGGAGGAGVAGTTSAAGNGGLGHANDFNGSSLYWAAGGGGGTYGISLGGDGGDGGIGGGGGGSVQQTSESGGTGGSSSLNSGEDGSAGNGHTPTNNSDGGSAGAHTGSGGGGAGYMNMTGGNGASGIVIVRYLK